MRQEDEWQMKAGYRRRVILTLIISAPVLVALVATGADLVNVGDRKEMACWVMPNARVLLGPADRGCPLRFDDQIRLLDVGSGNGKRIASARQLLEAARLATSALRIGVMRDGRLHWLELPVLAVSRERAVLTLLAVVAVTVVLLWIPLSLLWRSTSPAALPLCLLHSATSIVVIAMTCGRNSELLARMSIVAVIAGPAVVAHLGLTFPRGSGVIAEAPGLLAVPYGAAAMLLPTAWLALERDTFLWPTLMLVVVTLGAGSWLLLIVSCAFALRESVSPLERARARLVCVGSTLLPVVPASLLVHDLTEPAEFVSGYLWAAAIGMSWPIGLAISRYNLFNLGWDVRRVIGRVVYGCTAAALLTVAMMAVATVNVIVISGRDPLLIFSVCLGCVMLLEPIRARLLDLLESVLLRRQKQMVRARDVYERQIAELHEEDRVAQMLGEVVAGGLASEWGCVWLTRGAGWRPVHIFGGHSLPSGDFAEEVEQGLGQSHLLHVAEAFDAVSPVMVSLEKAGVVVAAKIESAGETMGLLLLGGRKRTPLYTEPELQFIGMAVRQAAIGIRNTRLSEGLVEAERQATTGRVALSLAHDLGKELDWLRRLVMRLGVRSGDPMRADRDIEMIREFADGLVVQVKDFVRETSFDSKRPERRNCADILATAVRRVERIHGDQRVVESLDPALDRASCDENLGRVVGNLLDNALRASRVRDAVHLYATIEVGWIRVLVTDRGCGLTDRERRRAFEPGFSTRSEDGGLGIGLALSRQMVEAVGGEIRLDPGEIAGTKATVRFPVACGSRVHEGGEEV